MLKQLKNILGKNITNVIVKEIEEGYEVKICLYYFDYLAIKKAQHCLKEKDNIDSEVLNGYSFPYLQFILDKNRYHQVKKIKKALLPDEDVVEKPKTNMRR